MNILHIIGNGFDKAMGMKTSYPEFYEYLKSLPEKVSSIPSKNQRECPSHK